MNEVDGFEREVLQRMTAVETKVEALTNGIKELVAELSKVKEYDVKFKDVETRLTAIENKSSPEDIANRYIKVLLGIGAVIVLFEGAMALVLNWNQVFGG